MAGENAKSCTCDHFHASTRSTRYSVRISDYYGRAQLELDLFGVAQVESLGVKAALSTVTEGRLQEALKGAPVERARTVEQLTKADAGQAGQAAAKAAKARDVVLKAGTAAEIEVRIGTALPTDGYLRVLVRDSLTQGSPAKDWWARQEEDTAFKLANEIRTGAAQGETNAEIIALVVGSDDTPGVMPIARKNAAAIVQTALQTVAAEARRATFEANSDLMLGIEQVSTLDGHTSLMCIAYSGAQWDQDYEPMGENHLPYNGGVPRHWNCRSAEIAVMKTFRDMGIDLDEPEVGTRASSDGPISAKTRFADYLKMKGEDYQNEVLGKGRADLFRAGKLSPRDLVDMSGRPLKLSALMALYPQ